LRKVLTDACSPPISAKARDDFITGYELLQADTLTSYDTVDKEIMPDCRLHLRYRYQPR
jgi:hypothetical protein